MVLLLVVLGVLAPATTRAQAIYGTVTGEVLDDSGAAVPGVTVSVVNQDTGLTLEGVSDDAGAYTIRNVTAGPYTLKASLQGFKEYVQTGIPVTPGGIVRVNAKLEVGSLTESVTVTTEAALLKTDKADVSVDLRPEEVVNLPLNQYRNYQALMNLVPGASPPALQNAQTDTPGRSLTTNVNGTARNTNTTRIDGAASINVWLPHHAGYIAPAETIENVNISTNSFDASQGMTGGAAMSVATKSGTNQLRGSAFYFRNQDEFNARQGYFDPVKLDASTSIMGGTVGGPILKNRLFYFGGWERNLQKQSRFDQFTVPTEKMRNGDFSEVLAFNPAFRIYDPRTGNATSGAGRDAFPGAVIPADRISSIARTIQSQYPAPNNAGTNNGLQNNLFVPRTPEATRDNYDLKVNWNRTSAHQIWAKYSMMDASVQDLFYLPFEQAGGGDTKVYLGTIGNTWTLSPTLILDGNVGFNIMNHQSAGPDYGTNYGLDVFGVPGTNSAGLVGASATTPERHSGMPVFETGLGILGNNATWTPVWRDERSYTASINLTKVAGKHEIRSGFDWVRLRLDHWQPENGNPRGTFSFNGGGTGIPGYAGVGGWNAYASFLLGDIGSFGKSVQYEEMTGRENQFGLYVSDRWQVNEKLTLNLGLRYELYPLFSRADRGLEVLDLNTFNVQLGGLGSNPKDLGLETSKTLFAPRLGATYRVNDDTVLRAGFGRTFNPMPWSRPIRDPYPLVIAYSGAGANGFVPYGTLAQGIPAAPNIDTSSGTVPLPRGVQMRTPDVGNVDRGTIDSWNVFVERRLALDLAVSAGYVATATRGGYGDVNLNYAESGGNVNRVYAQQAGNASILLWGSRMKANYHSMQVALNRPFKSGLLLKGAYTWSKALNEVDDDGRAAVLWSQPSQYARNYAFAGYDRPHMVQLGFVYELPFARESQGVLAQVIKNWQVNGIGSWLSGTPFTVGGDNGLLQQQGGQQTANVTGELKGGFGNAGPDQPWYDPSQFSQPGNAWGNSGRNAFRGPSNWNVDFSVFRAFPVGRYRLELRAESQNVFNHVQWGNPVTGITDPNFMRIRTYAPWRTPRTVQLGLRFQF
ncbi:MAG TPA: TonB-dependent receptor [Luteitalea sp.]|nr:TonB-dependent receptor [Luteitalea sp.]